MSGQPAVLNGDQGLLKVRFESGLEIGEEVS